MEPHAVIVEHVEPGSAAEQAGIQRGDRLTSFAGKPLTSPAMLQALDENTPGSDPVMVCGERDGQPWEWSMPPSKRGPQVRPEQPEIKVRPELPDAVLGYYEQGRAAYQVKDFAGAMRLWHDIPPHVPGKIARAWMYQQVGWASTWASEFQSALDALAMVPELLREGIDIATQIWAWSDLADCYGRNSDLVAARQCIEMVRQADEAMDWCRWLARDTARLASNTLYHGESATAKGIYSEAVRICEKFDSNDAYLGMLVNCLGNIALMQGDSTTARRQYTDSHEIWRRHAPGSTYDAIGYNNRGRIASRQGDFLAAMDFHSQALQINEQIDPYSHETGDSLNYVGSILLVRGDLASAQEYFVRTLDIWRLRGTLPGYIAKAHENLGKVAVRQGDLDDAIAHHRKALRIREGSAPLSPYVARSLTNLGNVALRRAEPEAAEDYFRRALAIYECIAPGSLENAVSLEGMGRVDLARRRPSEAVQNFRRAVEIVERHRTQIAAPEARALMLAQHLRKYAGLVESLLAVGQVGEAFHTLERTRARSFVELLTARTLDTADAPPELLQEQRDLDRRRSQIYDRLSGLTGADRDTATVKSLHRTLRELERRQQDVTAQIRAASPRYASLQYPQPLDLEEAQAALESGTLLLSYLVDDDRTFLFAVTATHTEAHALPIGREALQAQVRAFRLALDRNRLTHDPAQETALARALYAQLVRPVQTPLRRAERLLFCPDGPLHTLPFAALVTNARGRPRYLGTEKPLHSALSMTTHAQAQATRPALGPRPLTPRLLAFGDPLYGAPTQDPGPSPHGDELSQLQTRGLSLAPLPYTRREVEGLAKLFGDGATVRLGAEATKTAVLRESGDADLLHLACHAWFDPVLPLSSGLVLSRPEALGERAAPDDNGLLQAWEIFQRLSLSADLVVLSACQSGLGQEVRGEGLVGLTRAFQYAGARSLVVSLWDVNDASTALFMQAFYESLRDGAGRDEALQQGALALRADPRWDAPCYWAAFVLIGDRN